jgi:hypothetical protein
MTIQGTLTWPTRKKSRERLVPRRASSGLSTSSPRSPPVAAGTTVMAATPRGHRGDGPIAMPLDAELGLIVNHVARFL